LFVGTSWDEDSRRVDDEGDIHFYDRESPQDGSYRDAMTQRKSSGIVYSYHWQAP